MTRSRLVRAARTTALSANLSLGQYRILIGQIALAYAARRAKRPSKQRFSVIYSELVDKARDIYEK